MKDFFVNESPVETLLLVLILGANIWFVKYLISNHLKKSYILWHALVASSLMITLTLIFLMYNYFSNKAVKTAFESFENIRNVLLIVSAVVAILSLLITSYNSSVTSKNSLETHRANIIFNLIKQNAALTESKNFEVSLNNVLTKLKKMESNASVNKIHMFLKENKSEYLKTIRDIKIDLSSNPSFKFSNESLKFFNNPLSKIDYSSRLLTLYYSERNVSIFQERFSGDHNKGKLLGGKTFYDKFRATDFGATFEEFITSNNNLLNELDNYKFDNISKEVVEAIEDEYSNLGSFLRNTHRIIKLINEYFPNEIDRKNYFGILRSYYSEDVMLLIYVNCAYTIKGQGLAKQLIDSDFFGDKNDLKNEKDHGPHLQINELFAKSKNIKVLHLFTINSLANKEDLIQEIRNIFDKESA